MAYKALPLFITSVLLATLLICPAVAQTKVQGHVKDSITQNPLPYVNIGIPEKNIGTVSDESGFFSLTIPATDYNGTIRFSMIGYQSKHISIPALREPPKSGVVVTLTPAPIVLKEIEVKASQKGNAALGTPPRSKSVNAGFLTNMLGHEIGTVFRSKKLLALDSVQINFAKCAYEHVYLRLNVYRITQDSIFTNILQRPVYISLNRQQTLTHPVINLNHQEILLASDFMISVELIKDLGERGVFFYARLNDREFPVVYRKTSQGNWTYLHHKSKPVGISIIAFTH